MRLAAYEPPSAQQACVAAAVAPLGVLAVFTLLLCRLIDPDTTMVWLAALTCWVVVELHRYQRAMDAYNSDYVQRHLAWRLPRSLQQLADDEQQCPRARAFVQRYLDAGCQLRRDGQAV